MSTIANERPQFFEGQYLGADDLTSLLEYDRTADRRHALGGHTWGIAMGLQLHEQTNDAGDVEIHLLPGFAWDGYGRQITVLSPKPISPGSFEGQSSGLIEVWLGYSESEASGVRPGFEVCDASDQYRRVRETYVVVVGARDEVTDQQDGVVVGGNSEEDPREVLQAHDESAGLVCDASVPHQEFPEDADEPRWLVPLGKVQWKAGNGGVAGTIESLSESAQQISRMFRRYAGVVAEGIMAADGLIRLRRRTTTDDGSTENDDLCSASALGTSDFASSEGTEIDDLVWIEGNVRIIGDARLWGTKLELRNDEGDDDDVPLYLRRGPEAGLDDVGRDIEIVLGTLDDSEGNNRVVIGPVEEVTSGGETEERVEPRIVLTDDGRVGIGVEEPQAYHEDADDLVIATEAASGMSIVSGDGSTGNIFFAHGSGSQENERGRISYDHDGNKLGFGVEGEDHVFLTEDGQLGVGTDSPGDYSSLADDLVIETDGNSGLTIASGSSSRGRIHFANGTESDELARGFIGYRHGNDTMRLGTAGNVQVTVSADGDVLFHENGPARDRVLVTGDGRVGIGTEAPSAPLHVKASDPSVVLEASAGSSRVPRLEFWDGGTSKAKVHWRRGDDQLRLESRGNTSLVCDGADVGVGTTSPDARLHISDAVSGSAHVIGNHVAIVQNTSADIGADVLALKVGAANPTIHGNYITFFDGNGANGSISRNGLFGIRIDSHSADYAEWLPLEDPQLSLEAGDVVGVTGGRVGRDTQRADHVSVVTDQAIIAANSPPPDQRHRHALLTMLGQVRVKVAGRVRRGDVLVPSGKGDGLARASSPGELSLEDLERVIGRAWEASDDEEIKRVNCAVSMSFGMTAAALGRLSARVEALERRLGEDAKTSTE